MARTNQPTMPKVVSEYAASVQQLYERGKGTGKVSWPMTTVEAYRVLTAMGYRIDHSYFWLLCRDNIITPVKNEWGRIELSLDDFLELHQALDDRKAYLPFPSLHDSRKKLTTLSREVSEFLKADPSNVAKVHPGLLCRLVIGCKEESDREVLMQAIAKHTKVAVLSELSGIDHRNN